MLLIDWRNKCCWTLWNHKVWLIQRRHLLCKKTNIALYKDNICLSDITTLTYVLMDNFLSLFSIRINFILCIWFLFYVFLIRFSFYVLYLCIVLCYLINLGMDIYYTNKHFRKTVTNYVWPRYQCHSIG